MMTTSQIIIFLMPRAGSSHRAREAAITFLLTHGTTKEEIIEALHAEGDRLEEQRRRIQSLHGHLNK